MTASRLATRQGTFVVGQTAYLEDWLHCGYDVCTVTAVDLQAKSVTVRFEEGDEATLTIHEGLVATKDRIHPDLYRSQKAKNNR